MTRLLTAQPALTNAEDVLAEDSKGRRKLLLQIAVVAAIVIVSLWMTGMLDRSRLTSGLPAIGILGTEMFPPDFGRRTPCRDAGYVYRRHGAGGRSLFATGLLGRTEHIAQQGYLPSLAGRPEYASLDPRIDHGYNFRCSCRVWHVAWCFGPWPPFGWNGRKILCGGHRARASCTD